MARLTWMLAGLLRASAGLLPPERREWAEAVRVEAGQVHDGWPRLRWMAGGLWLVAREARMVRKVVYWIGAGAVAIAAVWAIWLSWRAVRAPYYDPQAVTDRVRVLAGVGAFVVLPWVGRRRHGWFGPVGAGFTARLVRVAGCVAMCGLGVILVRMDSHLTPGADIGPFSLSREIAGLVVLGIALALVTAMPLAKSRWPNIEAAELWCIAGMAGVSVLLILPLQVLPVVYVAGILAATARRSPLRPATLAIGTITGLASALVIYEVVTAVGDIGPVLFLIVLAMACLFAAPAGVAAAWLLPGTGDPQELRAARIRQGLLAGAVAGAVCGVVLTLFFVLAVIIMAAGPLAGAAAGAVGGVAAHHPRRLRPAGSRAAGLFVLSRTR
jgi:hypothetical protein